MLQSSYRSGSQAVLHRDADIPIISSQSATQTIQQGAYPNPTTCLRKTLNLVAVVVAEEEVAAVEVNGEVEEVGVAGKVEEEGLLERLLLAQDSWPLNPEPTLARSE